MAADPILEMERLMAAEHAMLIAGQFDKLPKVTAARTRLVEQLAQVAEADRMRLDRLRSMAERNARLLSAAMKGFRAAEQSLAGTRTASAAFTAYDRFGQSQTVSMQPSKHTRRS